ncbi:(d)CMP kinase [Natronospora cellulosivora (SeqCode)]
MKNVIAIDGPAGAGKSTLSKLLARKLDFIYLDTGAMYRAITFLALENGIDINDNEKLGELAKNTNFEFKQCVKSNTNKIIVNGIDITNNLRKIRIDKNVSIVAKAKKVRSAMLIKQREIAKNGNIIMDGRDIGSRVLPDADIKFFVTASLDERSKRRYLEMKKNNKDISLEKIKEKISKRDKMDIEREISPLCKTSDAILIDTTNLSIKEALKKMIKIVKGEKDVKTII